MASDFWFRIPVCSHADGMEAFLDVCVPSESGSFVLSKAEAYRLFCHALVQQLPDAAFDEAVEALSGMYEFYQDSPMLPAPLSPQSLKARITGSYTAPVYPITEE